MRRILTVNIMILLIFASASYWMEEGEKLKDTMASAETIQAEVSEPEVEKKYIKVPFDSLLDFDHNLQRLYYFLDQT